MKPETKTFWRLIWKDTRQFFYDTQTFWFVLLVLAFMVLFVFYPVLVILLLGAFVGILGLLCLGLALVSAKLWIQDRWKESHNA